LLTLLVGAVSSCAENASSTSTPTSTDPDVEAETSQSVEVADVADAPEWYEDRRELPSCGVDEEYGDGYPNHDARRCFRDAFLAAEPAELTRLQFGDEGESIRAHFRVLGGGRYEIVAEQFPSPVDERFGGDGWIRYECDGFEFIDDPGGEVDLVPWINFDGECRLVEEVSK
jgi:hypothetical protein